MDLRHAKKATLRNGMVVTNMHYVPLNSAGEEVTFPIKGSIHKEYSKRRVYGIWTLSGAFHILGESPYDIISIEE